MNQAQSAKIVMSPKNSFDLYNGLEFESKLKEPCTPLVFSFSLSTHVQRMLGANGQTKDTQILRIKAYQNEGIGWNIVS